MSTLQVRTAGGAGTANLDLVDLPDGSKAIAHAVLGGDGNPMVPASDASMAALVAAVEASVAAATTFVASRTVVAIVDTFGATVATSSVLNSGGAETDAFGNPLS